MNIIIAEQIIALINEHYWRLFPRRISKEEIAFLERNFFYYNRLQEPYKKEFIQKLQLILSTKKFVPRGGLKKITFEMEILIGATIVMVTFGWERLRLAHFNRIVVYPNSYYSSINQTYHKGEVNPRLGVIVIGWNHFVHGFSDLTDGINLGIHEVAHALKLSNYIQSDPHGSFSVKAFEEYRKWVPDELEKIRGGRDSIFRERGGEDEHEFFAVVLEAFFEKSHDFHSYHPNLYQALVGLLRQDPRVILNKE